MINQSLNIQIKLYAEIRNTKKINTNALKIIQNVSHKYVKKNFILIHMHMFSLRNKIISEFSKSRIKKSNDLHENKQYKNIIK